MQRERKEMKVSECIIQGVEEDGGRLQKKDEIITSSDAQPKFCSGRECLLKVMLGK